MIRNLTNRIILIVVVLALALVIDFSSELNLLNPVTDETLFTRDLAPRLGLDLQGGLQVLLEADLPADAQIDSTSMDIARDIAAKSPLVIARAKAITL